MVCARKCTVINVLQNEMKIFVLVFLGVVGHNINITDREGLFECQYRLGGQ